MDCNECGRRISDDKQPPAFVRCVDCKRARMPMDPNRPGSFRECPNGHTSPLRDMGLI